MSSNARGAFFRQLVCFVALSTTPLMTHADDKVVLEARPATCVALHKGQACFRSIRLAWSPLEQDEQYCLMLDDNETPLICWTGNTLTEHTHKYTAISEEHYFLVRGPQREPIADSLVQTAWVYRSNRRGASGWRLF